MPPRKRPRVVHDPLPEFSDAQLRRIPIQNRTRSPAQNVNPGMDSKHGLGQSTSSSSLSHSPQTVAAPGSDVVQNIVSVQPLPPPPPPRPLVSIDNIFNYSQIPAYRDMMDYNGNNQTSKSWYINRNTKIPMFKDDERGDGILLAFLVSSLDYKNPTLVYDNQTRPMGVGQKKRAIAIFYRVAKAMGWFEEIKTTQLRTYISDYQSGNTDLMTAAIQSILKRDNYFELVTARIAAAKIAHLGYPGTFFQMIVNKAFSVGIRYLNEDRKLGPSDVEAAFNAIESKQVVVDPEEGDSLSVEPTNDDVRMVYENVRILEEERKRSPRVHTPLNNDNGSPPPPSPAPGTPLSDSLSPVPPSPGAGRGGGRGGGIINLGGNAQQNAVTLAMAAQNATGGAFTRATQLLNSEMRNAEFRIRYANEEEKKRARLLAEAPPESPGPPPSPIQSPTGPSPPGSTPLPSPAPERIPDSPAPSPVPSSPGGAGGDEKKDLRREIKGRDVIINSIRDIVCSDDPAKVAIQMLIGCDPENINPAPPDIDHSIYGEFKRRGN